MQLSNTKMLLTSCCDKLITRNSSVATANQHLLNSNLFALRKSSPLSNYKVSNRSTQPVVTFSTFALRKSRLSFQQRRQTNAEPVNCLKAHQANSEACHPKVSSIDYNSYCKRHYNSKNHYPFIKQQFGINSTHDSKRDYQRTIRTKSAISNQFSTNCNSRREGPQLDNHHQTSSDEANESNFKSNQISHTSVNSSPISLSNQQSKKNPLRKASSITGNTHSQESSSSSTGQQDFTDLINVRSIYRNNLLNQSDQADLSKMAGVPFKPRRALILTKFSRLEYERRRLSDYTEEEVKESLIRRGSDYESLLNHHSIHTKSKEHVAKTLTEFGIEHRIVNRFEYNQEQIDWADVIITTGGDGTFLMAASKIFNKDKLVIGINSDPSRSVGYLCLQPNYSINFRPALEKLSTGDFRWVYRQRIRVSIKGENAMDAPAELHDQQLLHPEFRYLDLETHPLNRRCNSPHRPEDPAFEYQVLPVRALNDVFVGECLSSRVSYFELQIENKPFVKVKSSGVTICTGTGSTSWSFNINKISPQSISTLFKIINEETNANLDASNEQLTKSITKKFNDSLIFDVCKNSMAYTVRDPVYMGNGFDSDNRGFAENIVVKSRMFDACVVIDGGLSYKFNDGAYAKFELLEEDQLKTVAF